MCNSCLLLLFPVFLNLSRWSIRLKARVTWVNLIFFINQNDVILVKNKKIVNEL
jgi:hypothetical protein